MTTQTTTLTTELQKYFGFNSFKAEQEAIIQNVLDGNDTFVVMPTGGGKSMCYQLQCCTCIMKLSMSHLIFDKISHEV